MISLPIWNCAADLKLQRICKTFLLKAIGQRYWQMPKGALISLSLAGAL
jgi:hypothetical protein